MYCLSGALAFSSLPKASTAELLRHGSGTISSTRHSDLRQWVVDLCMNNQWVTKIVGRRLTRGHWCETLRAAKSSSRDEGQNGSTAPKKRRVRRTKKTKVSEEEKSASITSADLKKMHEELMSQIEERKKAQSELANMLNKSPASSVAAPAPAPPKEISDTPLKKPTELVFQSPLAEDTTREAKGLDERSADVPPKPNNPNAMNIVVVSSECAPWSKTGGLGDVAGSLPKALAGRGHRVMAISPRYHEYDNAWETGVRHRVRVMGQEHEYGYFHAYVDGVDYVFVDHPAYRSFGDDIYGGSRQDLQFRCALLCKAALEAPWIVPCGDTVYGDESLMFIANDWQAALVPFYLQAHYRDYGQLAYARSVFVIHNMAHQGRAPMDELAALEVPDHYREFFRLDDPIGGEHMNIMKAGIITSHRMVAVSHGYAWECQTQEGGWGLDAVIRDHGWKLRGVVNGIDLTEWSPSVDAHLTSDGYTNYDIKSLNKGKAACKAALQKEFGLPVNPDVPLLAFIGRLDYQKGVDLICDNYEWLMSQGVQLILLGSGRDDLETMLREMEAKNGDKCKAWVGFSVRTAHRLTAGADILLMPSRFEPCGLNQLYAMAYGTVPVVHAVGGLRDTVHPFNPFENTGTGWTFEWADSAAFQRALGDALYTYREHRESFQGIQVRGMDLDLSWAHAAEQYEEVLVEAKYQW